MNRFFEKHVEIERNEDGQMSKTMMALDYYLLEDEREWEIKEDIDDITGDTIRRMETRKSYGIEIVKSQIGAPDEKECFRDLFQSRERAQGLVQMLVRQTVTPSALPYILDDLIGI